MGQDERHSWLFGACGVMRVEPEVGYEAILLRSVFTRRIRWRLRFEDRVTDGLKIESKPLGAFVKSRGRWM